jgi:hypothetical protein
MNHICPYHNKCNFITCNHSINHKENVGCYEVEEESTCPMCIEIEVSDFLSQEDMEI